MKKGTSVRIPTPVKYAVNAALFTAFILVLNALVAGKVINTSTSKVIMLIGVNIILAVSLNIATGYLGQLPLGHAGFMAVGAYTCAIFMKAVKGSGSLQLLFIVGLLMAGLMAAAFGFLIGIPALRLKGDYLAIITLGFGEIIRVVIQNIDGVVGFKLTFGASGFSKFPKTTTVLNAFLWVGAVCFVTHTIMKSRHGRAILSIRDNEIASESCGIPTTFYKTFGFVLSAFFAGIAGGLYAGYIGIIQPGDFDFMKSIEILVMVVLGGMGSMLGSVVSAVCLTTVNELLRAFSDYRMVAYALLLIAVMIFRPKGLMGTYDFSMGRVLEKAASLVRGKGGKGA